MHIIFLKKCCPRNWLTFVATHNVIMAATGEEPVKETDKSKQGILHIRLDQVLLDDSQALAKELGFNLSTHVRVLLRKALDERKKRG